MTLVDRNNFHLFQPLAYQVATGALSAAEIAAPLRAVLKRQRNLRVVMAEVTGFDLARREVLSSSSPNGEERAALAYDTLIVAGGSRYSYFGHDEWQRSRRSSSRSTGALEIRSRILGAFEAAEVEQDPDARRSWLTFVVVGAGPTGVEMAGQIAELASDTLRRDYRSVDTAHRAGAARRVGRSRPHELPAVALAEGGEGARPARRRPRWSTIWWSSIGPDSVAIRAPDGEVEQIDARTVIWAAGVTASELAARSPARPGLEVDQAGRVTVEPDLTLPGHPEVFAIGDMVRVRAADGTATPLPGVAPVAMQQGRYAAPPDPRPPARKGDARRSATSTRATSPRSAAPRPSPTSRASASPASPPGCSGSSSTSST